MKGNMDNIWNLRKLLNTFCELLGEMINAEKSYTVFSKNTPRKFIRLLNKGLKVGNKEKLGKYLGCPMDVTGHSLHTFKDLSEKVASTISSWKFSALNQAGKMLLINSILIAFASHIMATYLLPKKMLNKTTSVFLKFWWSSSHDKKPIYWRKRSLLEKHKHEGGLGLRNLIAQNKAILFKQAWRIQNNPNLLVSQIFRAKYSEN